MEAASAILERRVEAAAEAYKFVKRVMKEADEESEVKAAAAKASDSVSLDDTSSTVTAASTAASVFTRDPTYTSFF